MKKINLKGITAENVTGIFILLVALINATLQMFGINILPISNEEVSNIVSTIFLIIVPITNIMTLKVLSLYFRVRRRVMYHF